MKYFSKWSDVCAAYNSYANLESRHRNLLTIIFLLLGSLYYRGRKQSLTADCYITEYTHAQLFAGFKVTWWLSTRIYWKSGLICSVWGNNILWVGLGFNPIQTRMQGKEKMQLQVHIYRIGFCFCFSAMECHWMTLAFQSYRKKETWKLVWSYQNSWLYLYEFVLRYPAHSKLVKSCTNLQVYFHFQVNTGTNLPPISIKKRCHKMHACMQTNFSSK